MNLRYNLLQKINIVNSRLQPFAATLKVGVAKLIRSQLCFLHGLNIPRSRAMCMTKSLNIQRFIEVRTKLDLPVSQV